MDNEVFTPVLKKFTRSPLVTWVSVGFFLLACHSLVSFSLALCHHPVTAFQIRTFGPLAEENGNSLEEYLTLVDGVFLNEVMLQM